MGLLFGLFIAVAVFIAGIVCTKLIFGRLFEPMFSDDFPEELKSFTKENIRYFHPNRIQELLKRYKEAKSEKDFSLEEFLKKEDELIKQRK